MVKENDKKAEMENQLKLERYSYRTRKTYLQHMKQFVPILEKTLVS